MITEIGIAAGDIWQHLDKNGSTNLTNLVRKIGKSRELLLMSLGWLAREGYVSLVESGSDFQASLINKKP